MIKINNKRKSNTGNVKSPVIKKTLWGIASVLFWIIVWEAVARTVGIELILPTPMATLKKLFELFGARDFYVATGLSLLRIFGGTAAAVLAGTVFGTLSEKFSIIGHLLSPAITVIRATPVVSFIIIAFLWLGNSLLPAFISFLMVFPIIYTAVRSGIESTPRQLLNMAKVFGLSAITRIKRIYVPSAAPFFITAVNSSFGLAWKAGVAAEVLVCTKNSIGLALYNSKTYLETTELFAWTTVIVILSLIIEKSFSALTVKILKKPEDENAETE